MVNYGGGNTAMDAARAASALIIYMCADEKYNMEQYARVWLVGGLTAFWTALTPPAAQITETAGIHLVTWLAGYYHARRRPSGINRAGR
jgi:hypothetical protein